MRDHFSSGNKNLVIVRAGRNSLHRQWIAAPGAEPQTFDLLVTAYEDGPPTPARADVASICVPGRKIAGFRQIFADYPWLLQDYDHIAWLDDDLETDVSAINRAFAMGQTFGLKIWQPSLTPDSYFSYAVSLRNRAFLVRYVNFIEMMCPFFASDALRDVLPLLALGKELGVDLLWCRRFDAPWFKCGVLDAVTMKHTRRVGTTAVQQGFGEGRRYDDEMAEALAMFGATFRGPVAYAAVTTEGRLIMRRAAMARKVLGLFAEWKVSPMPRKYFFRAVTDHVRHCLTRPLNLAKIDDSRILAAQRLATGEGARPGKDVPR